MVGALTAGVLSVIIAHHHLVARGRALPLAPIYSRPGESCCAFVRPGSFPCHDVGLYLLTIVGPRLLHWMPPRWWLPSSKSNSLPENGSWSTERLPSSSGRRACWSPPAHLGR
jgi:hypothetical protein